MPSCKQNRKIDNKMVHKWCRSQEQKVTFVAPILHKRRPTYEMKSRTIGNAKKW